VQLIGALGNADTIEGVTCTSDDVDFGNYIFADGVITPPETPGFGMKLLR
jgi:L-alanine-DL-glutamate epimerase-like enolase superfamily enzyme